MAIPSAPAEAAATDGAPAAAPANDSKGLFGSAGSNNAEVVSAQKTRQQILQPLQLQAVVAGYLQSQQSTGGSRGLFDSSAAGGVDHSEFLRAMTAHRSLIASLDVFKRSSKSAADRQTLSTPVPAGGAAPAGIPSGMKITQEIYDAVVALSDELDMNEMEVARRYHCAQQRDMCVQFADLTNADAVPLEGDAKEATRQMIFAEKLGAANALAQLMEARSAQALPEDQLRVVMEESNSLLRDGIAMKLMTTVQQGVDELLKPDLSAVLRGFIVNALQVLANCLFYTFYRTQITQAEVTALTGLIMNVSSVVISQKEESSIQWLPGLNIALIILQLAHVRSLNQKEALLLRDHNEAPYGSGLPGNALPTPVRSRDNLDRPWSCSMAKGLASLASAILRQPAVEESLLPGAEVVWFLQEASVNMAFTYIRVCMLPVIHSMHGDRNKEEYLAVLCDLVFDSLTLFCQPIYHTSVFPFPVSQISYYEDAHWRSNVEVSANGQVALLPRDTQEDVVTCVTALCDAYPQFALRFWVQHVPDSTRLFGDTVTSLSNLNAMRHHPFIGRGFDGSLDDESLLVPVLRLLSSIAQAGYAENVQEDSQNAYALAVYNFVLKKHPNVRDWGHFFHVIDYYVQHLQSDAAAAPTTTMEAARSVSNAPRISPQDVDGLCAIIELVGSVAAEPGVYQAFVAHGYNPIVRLFNLLSCPVPARLKGKVYRALAGISRNSADVAVEIWNALESYQVLTTSAQKQSPIEQQFGLRYELEAIESIEGLYPATEGFLVLVEELLVNHRIPRDLGLSYRLPGINIYVDFIVDDILLKAAERNYANAAGTDLASGIRGDQIFYDSFSTTSQRWSIVARALRILSAIIQQYPIHELANSSLAAIFSKDDQVEFECDFREETRSYDIDVGLMIGGRGNGINQSQKQVWPRPKTSGFAVMARLLDSYGALLNTVMGVLKENGMYTLDAVTSNQLRSRSVDSLKALVISSNRSKEPQSIQYILGDHHAPLFHYGLLSMPASNGDVLFWREKCVNRAIGLLYETCLRERAFLTRVRSAPPLTLLRVVNGRPSVQELHLTDVFVSLTSHLCRSPHTLIAHFIRYSAVSTFGRSVTVPTIPVMAVRILEHSVPDNLAEEQLMLRSAELFDSSPGFYSAPGAASYRVNLVSAFALALLDNPPFLARLNRRNDAPPSEIVPLCAADVCVRNDVYSIVLSDDATYSSSISIASEALDVRTIGTDGIDYSVSRGVASTLQVPQQYYSFLHRKLDASVQLTNSASAQSAVLDFLLRSYSPRRYGLVSRLLGFAYSESSSPSMTSDGVVSKKIRLVPNTIRLTAGSADGISTNCLFAALDILDRIPSLFASSEETEEVFSDLIVESDGHLPPLQKTLHIFDVANKCLELLYRLCEDPLTSDAVLELLRHRSSGASSEEGAGVYGFYSRQMKLCASFVPASLPHVEPDRTLLQACRINYAATFIRIMALELHTSELRQEAAVSSQTLLGLLSNLFARSARSTQGFEDAHLPIISLLGLISKPSVPQINVDNAAVLKCIEAATRPYKAGASSINSLTESASFTVINVRELLKELQGCDISSLAGASEASSDETIERYISLAASYNRYTVQVASVANFCQAWRQIVDVSFLGCGSLLVTPLSSADEPLLTFQSFVDRVLLPLLEVLSQNPDLEMVVAEPLSRATLSMVAFFREMCASLIEKVCQRTDSGASSRYARSSRLSMNDATISEGQHEAVLRGVILAILRRGAPGVARIESSLLYRSFLYASLSHVLSLMTVPSLDGDVSSRSNFDQDAVGAYEAAALEYGVRNMLILEPFANVLADTVLRDATSAAPTPYWRVNAVSALGTVLSALLSGSALTDGTMGAGSDTDFSSNAYNQQSTGYHQILQLFVSRGYLHTLFRYGLVPSADMDLYGSIIGLAITVSNSVQGVHLLISNQLLSVISGLPVVDISGLQYAYDAFKHLSVEERSRAVDEMEASVDALWSPIVRLLTSMLTMDSQNIELLECAVQLLHKNEQLVGYLLGLRMHSLRGLEMTRALVALMAILSSYCRGIATSTSSRASSALGMRTQWDKVLGVIGDWYTTDICALVKAIGHAPIPGLTGQMDAMRRVHYEGQREAAEWWTAVQPSTDRDTLLLDAICTPPIAAPAAAAALRIDDRLASQVSKKMMKVNRAWSVFDAQKLSLGHKILESAAGVLRARASHILTHLKSGAGLGLAASFDVASITAAFCACANLYRTRPYAAESALSADRDRNNSWLVSADAVLASPGFASTARPRGARAVDSEASEEVHKSLLYVSENLICALYYVAEAMTVEELSKNTTSFRSVLTACEAFDAHSFLSETGRRLSKLLG